jgi:phage baseplate assembly protein W
MRPLSFPYRVDRTGRTAVVEPDREIRELIEQLLFVAPGERVMRPELGSGVAQLVFAPASEHVAATAQHVVQGALQTWLGDRLSIDDVEVIAEESMLTVTIRYRVRLTGEASTATVTGAI